MSTSLKVFSHEFLKIYSTRSFFAVLAAILITNLILMYSNTDNGWVVPTSYQKLYADLAPMSEEEKYDYVEALHRKLSIISEFEWNESIPEAKEFEDNEYLGEIYEQYRQGNYLTYTQYLYTELALIEECYEDAQTVKNYAQYLRDIATKAELSEDISIFRSDDTYTQRNAQKTAYDFAPLHRNQLVLTNSKGITTAMNFVVTDIAMILILFILANHLITVEKQKGLFALIRPTRHGKGRLIAAKISVMSFSAVTIGVIFWVGNIVLCCVLYGLPDLNAPIQSISGFVGSVLPISILQYLLLFVFSKTTVYIVLGLFFLWFAQTSRFAVLIYIKVIILFLVSTTAYLLMPAYSALSMLRYINIINFMLTTPIYRYYYNLNIFSFPISMILIFALISVLCILILILVNILCFCRNDVSGMEKLPYFWQIKKTLRANTSILYHELYKILVANKGLMVILLLLGFQMFSFFNRTNAVVGDAYYYKQYMQALEGPDTEEKRALLKMEMDRFAEIDERIQEVNKKFAAGEISIREYEQSLGFYSNEQKTRRAFTMVLDRVQYMNDKKENTVEGLWFVYEKGWEFLTGGADTGARQDIVNALAMVIAMITTYSAVFAGEFSSGMIRIISTCKGGRLEVMKNKIRVCLALTLIFMIITYLPDIVYSMKNFGIDSISSPLASLPDMTAFPLSFPVWLYLTLLLIARFMVMTAVMFVILFVSTVSKDTVKCIVISTASFIIPLLLHMLGIKTVDYFTLNRFLTVNPLLNNGIASQWLNILLISLSLVIPISIILFMYYSLKKRFAE